MRIIVEGDDLLVQRAASGYWVRFTPAGEIAMQYREPNGQEWSAPADQDDVRVARLALAAKVKSLRPRLTIATAAVVAEVLGVDPEDVR